MTRFNVRQTERETNYEGSAAFKLDPQMALYSTVCTSLLAPKYYRSDTEDQLNELRHLIRNNDPEFVARLAVYARENMYMRTIPLVLMVELARLYNQGGSLKKAVGRVVARPDEITELLSYYMKANARTNLKQVSKQLIKGLKVAFNKFDEYQLAKWNRKGAVTLRDALRLVRPVPKDDAQGEIFQRVCTNTLEVPYTWESEFASMGRELNRQLLGHLYAEFNLGDFSEEPFTSLTKLLTALSEAEHPEYDTIVKIVESARKQAKKATWERLIDSGKMGYQATLMNLRNFLQYDVSMEHIQKVADRLADPTAVRNSKMFPFRFLSAYRVLVQPSSARGMRGFTFAADMEYGDFNQDKVDIIVGALERAVVQSIDNVTLFDGSRSLIACDVSGSMMNQLSPKSTITNYDVGLVLGMLLKKKFGDNAHIGIFGDSFKVKNIEGDVLAGVNQLYGIEGEVGYSTNGYKVLQHLLDTNLEVDKVVMFTDCQMYSTTPPERTSGWHSFHGARDSRIPELWTEYKGRYPNAKLYLFDMSGYGTTPISIKDNDVALIAGFSPEIFNVLKNLEDGRDALENINSIEL